VQTIQPDNTHRGVPGVLAPDSVLDDDEPPSQAERRARLVLSDEARARRRHLGRYVGVVVAIALAICVAAVARAITADRTQAATRTATANASPTATATAVAPAASPTPAGASPAAPPAASSASADTTVTPDPKAALKAKHQSQRALDAGKLADAIESGEHAVALDPSDAESWLILGAAYQARGATADARRCFSSCMRLGKRGPRRECAAMLR
jgi:Flp pilus assembly protein TadD